MSQLFESIPQTFELIESQRTMARRSRALPSLRIQLRPYFLLLGIFDFSNKLWIGSWHCGPGDTVAPSNNNRFAHCKILSKASVELMERLSLDDSLLCDHYLVRPR